MQGIDSDLIRGHIDTIILNILGEGDRYGYEICKEVEVKSNGAYELKQPTLYSCLKRLETQGLISSYWEDSDIGGKRHYYKLTDKGQLTYKKNQEDWARSKQIIDNLISANNAPINNEIKSETNVESNLSNNIESKTKEDLPDNDNNNELIFEEIDKEIEAQDKGSVDLSNSSNYISSNENNKAKSQGFDEVDEIIMPFDDNNYNSYCTHLVKNSETNQEPPIHDEDDIMALLGHTEMSVNKSSTPSNQEKTNNEEKSQEDEFLEKFITGKYSEYNPNKDEYIEALKLREEEEAQLKEAERLEKQLFLTDVTNIDDEKEFEDQQEDNLNVSSFFDSVDDEPIIDNTVKTQDEIATDSLPKQTVEQTNQTQINTIANNKAENSIDEKDSPYGTITYFNLNKPTEQELKEVSTENVLSDFANKYDAEIPDSDDDVYLDFTKSKDNENDEIAMDFSTPLQTEKELDNKPDIDEIDISHDDDYSSFMEDLEKKGIDPQTVEPFENKVDLTSVYDKADTNFSPNYTDNETKEKLNELTNSAINANLFKDINKEEKELVVDTSVDGIVSTVPTTTQPKDLSNLKADLQQEGITVRPYYKTVKEPVTTKTFIETNKIKMVRNWIVFFLEAVLLGITLLVVNKLAFTSGTFMDTYIYFVCGIGLMFILAMYTTIKYWINPYKKVTSKYAPRISHLFALLFTVQFFVIIYCINLQFGFYSFSQTDYNHLNWIVPCVVSLCPILQSIIYELLYKSKNFHI